MMSEKKKDKSTVAENVALGANAEMLGRHSEAGKQFIVGYEGVDNAARQKLHQGLKQIGKYKRISVDKNGKIIDNIGTQQGYSAEVLDTAKQNAENIKRGKSVRIARTDDVPDKITGKKRVNDPLHDQVALDAKSKVIDGSGAQMKFYEPDRFFEFIAGKRRGKHGKLWRDKYSDGKFRVPSDQFDKIKDKIKGEIQELAEKKSLTQEQQQNLEYLKKVDQNLEKSLVSRAEAYRARSNPRRVTVEEIAKTSHQAGVEAAKVGAGVGFGISVITNTVAVLRGEKQPEEAAAEVAKTTIVTGGVSYTTGFANTAIASAMKNSTNELTRQLGKANAPAYIIQTAISTAKSLGRLCGGEITADEFFLEVGKDGTGLLASAQGAIVGQLLIPVPVVGALVGGLVSSLLCGVIYDYTIGMRALNEEIDAFCDQLNSEIVLLKKYQEQLMRLDINRFKRETQNFAVVADHLSGDYSAQDFNTMLKLTYEYIGIPCPWGSGSLDDFMADKGKALTFG